MYNANIAPIGMGVGAGAALPFSGMSGFWVILAVFALIACASAINRIVPRIVIEGQDWTGSRQKVDW